MLANVMEDSLFIAGWLASALGLVVAVATLLSAAVRRRPARWTFPGTVLAVPRAAGLPPWLFMALLAVLVAGIPVLMGLLLARLSG